MNPVRFRSFIIICCTLLLLAGCSQAEETLTPLATEVGWPTQGWPTAAPEAQGMDSRVLAAMLKTIQDQNSAIDSVTVIRNGSLILDAAIYPYDTNTKHIIHSCTKSIVSILIGITIDQGYIEDVQTPVLEFFSDRRVDNLDANKERMTLENLLTMTTGLNCRDSYLYNWGGLNEMRRKEDWIQHILDLPMANTPGSYFEYCNGSSFLLSAIISETTGTSALEFAENSLFDRLGISDVTWPSNSQGINIGWGELRMLPHDMAKIGYLYLKGGEWDGEQIVPSSWVDMSTRSHTPATLEDGYGYQWWVDDSGYYLALGYRGQFIFVVPEKDMVVVFTSTLSDYDFYVPQILLEEFIIPAAVSSEPIPLDPSAEAALRLLIEDLSSP